MTTLLNQFLPRITLGDPQQHRGLVMVPLFIPAAPTADYLTLTEAFEAKAVIITEASQAGQVPKIHIASLSDRPILLTEGEELIGAKQNRVLNTSILLPAKAEMDVPVSCTEAGRWHYKTPVFADAGFVSPHKLRKVKSRSVSQALRCAAGHKSDQQAVWGTIQGLHAALQCHSLTSAMQDLYAAKAQALNDYSQNLQPSLDQNGLVMVVNGEIAGCDMVSSARAYQVLHGKYIRSYALEALLGTKPANGEGSRERVSAFFEACKASAETVHPAVGCGEDHRFEGAGVAGAALVVDSEVVHLNLFRN